MQDESSAAQTVIDEIMTMFSGESLFLQTGSFSLHSYCIKCMQKNQRKRRTRVSITETVDFHINYKRVIQLASLIKLNYRLYAYLIILMLK